MNFTEMINANYKFLNDNDIHILKYIINNKKKVSNMTIENLADECNISRTTILRLCKKLDFKGYSEFKTFLKWDMAAKTSIKYDAMKEIERSFNETMLILKSKNIGEICKVIDESDRIFVIGSGSAQRIFADELKRVFLFQNKYLNVIKGETELDVCIQNLQSEDLVILISHSGSDERFISNVQKILLKSSKTLSITTVESNQLASLVDYSLYGYSSSYNIREDQLYNSTFFNYTILEFLFVSYAQYVISKNEKIKDFIS